MLLNNPNHKRQAHGKSGELRTASILTQYFEVLQSQIDDDGADHIVAIIDGDGENRTKDIMKYGIVQSKFFEGKNQVKIKEKYALHNNEPKDNFFVYIHTTIDGIDTSYFLTALDVLNLPERDGFRIFSPAHSEKIEEFKNTNQNNVAEKIQHGIYKFNEKLIEKYNEIERERIFFYFRWRSGEEKRPEYVEYHLLNIPIHSKRANTRAKVVVFYSDSSSETRAIDARWDLFPAAQTWSWGYKGTGPHLLAASIIEHYLGPKMFNRKINKLLLEYISHLDPDEDHIITSDILENIIRTSE